MDEAPVIQVEGLGKQYILHHQKRADTLRDQLALSARRLLRLGGAADDAATRDPFWALRDVSFEVKRGEVVGVIGRNGAGKSTLLKILSRITEPTTGRVELRGRVSSLLEVGTGFHPELSGRENIFLNGAILGMTRSEIRRKFDEIVAFAEVERFLDTPVKHYSSGMYVRLAFAVAAHLEPEILIVDEVLAVGDMQFQKKCLGKMQDVARGEGRTVLFVSHNAAAIAQLCSKGLVLRQGRVDFWGTAEQSLAHYSKSVATDTGSMVDDFKVIDPRVKVTAARLNGQNQRSVHVAPGKLQCELEVDFTLAEPLTITMEARMLDQFGGCIGFFCPGHADPDRNLFQLPAGRNRLRGVMQFPPLHRGGYQIDLALIRPGICYYARAPQLCTLQFDGTPMPDGTVFDQSAQGVGYQVVPGVVRHETAG